MLQSPGLLPFMEYARLLPDPGPLPCPVHARPPGWGLWHRWLLVVIQAAVRMPCALSGGAPHGLSILCNGLSHLHMAMPSPQHSWSHVQDLARLARGYKSARADATVTNLSCSSCRSQQVSWSRGLRYSERLAW